GHDLQERRNQSLAATLLKQCLRNFERHSRPAKSLRGIGTRLLIRIQDGERFRISAIMRKVMIGNDQIKSKPLRRLSSSKRANAGVDADNQPDSLLGRALNHLVAHSIALKQTMRNMEVARPAQQLDYGLQYDRGHRAIHVI